MLIDVKYFFVKSNWCKVIIQRSSPYQNKSKFSLVDRNMFTNLYKIFILSNLNVFGFTVYLWGGVFICSVDL